MEERRKRPRKETISGIKRVSFRILTSLLTGIINNIKDEELKTMLRTQFEKPLQAFGKVLSDNNPDDAAQIKTVWREINGDFKQASLENLKVLVTMTIDNEDVEDILLDIITDYQEGMQADGYKTPPPVLNLTE